MFLKIQVVRKGLSVEGCRVLRTVEYKRKRNQRCLETGRTGRTGFAENQKLCTGSFEIHMFGVRDPSSLNSGTHHLLRKPPLYPPKSSRVGLYSRTRFSNVASTVPLSIDWRNVD